MTSTEKSATIYIVRHGETIGNITRIFLHPDFDILSDIGKNQASLLAENLKDVCFTKVYVSEFPRTSETANIILDGNVNPFSRSEIKVDSRLREIGMEHTYGKTYAHLVGGLVKILNSGQAQDDFNMEDSEPIPQVRKRAKEAMKDIFREAFATSEPQTILVVSHGACIRFLMEELYTGDEFETKGWHASGMNIMRNTGFMKLFVKKINGKINIDFQKFHQVSHLPKEMLETDSLTKLANTPEGKCLSGCFQV